MSTLQIRPRHVQSWIFSAPYTLLLQTVASAARKQSFSAGGRALLLLQLRTPAYTHLCTQQVALHVLAGVGLLSVEQRRRDGSDSVQTSGQVDHCYTRPTRLAALHTTDIYLREDAAS